MRRVSGSASSGSEPFVKGHAHELLAWLTRVVLRTSPRDWLAGSKKDLSIFLLRLAMFCVKWLGPW